MKDGLSRWVAEKGYDEGDRVLCNILFHHQIATRDSILENMRSYRI